MTIEYKIGDCLELMKELPDNSIDLVLTDPPYGIGIGDKVGGDKPFGNKRKKSTGKNTIKAKEQISFNDSTIPEKETFNEMFRISKHQIIFGGNYFLDYLPSTSCMIVWDKDNSGNFADCELAWTSFNSAVRMFKFRWNGMLQEDMKNKEERVHPTQKPIPLFKWILENYSNEGDLILDPFLGSGTTLRACRETNRNGIGFEKEAKYEPIIRKRIMADIPSLDRWRV